MEVLRTCSGFSKNLAGVISGFIGFSEPSFWVLGTMFCALRTWVPRTMWGLQLAFIGVFVQGGPFKNAPIRAVSHRFSIRDQVRNP